MNTKISVAFQGTAGAHSEVALRRHFASRGVELEAAGVETFRDVAAAVATGHSRYGLIPVDSGVRGTFRDGYDLISQYDLRPVREIAWKMDHRLLGVPGASLSTVRQIEGHPLVLEECGRFLATLSAARAVPAVDTGAAARDVGAARDPARAAIAPPEAMALYGLVELAGNVGDVPDPVTRFLLVESPAETVTPSEGARRRTSICFSTPDQPGALSRGLALLADAGTNVSKLESRPRRAGTSEAFFYADLDCDGTEPTMRAVLSRFASSCDDYRFLGSYDRDEAPAVERAVAPLSPSFPALLAELKAPSKNFPLASRSRCPRGTRVAVGSVEIGGSEFVVIAGPCSVESREQVMSTAAAVRAAGARLLRGGIFKPRTTPYAFQGLGWDGLSLLAEAGRAQGMPTVTEVMSVEQVERLALGASVLQIGARNMQNFDLLKAVGRARCPVLLKRGLSASLEELLSAAEYILFEGNPDVILCERGIRTFETATRNTLDLSAVPVLRERTHLPIVVDPSHAVGVRRWIRPLARAAKVAGAHGLLLEVHPNPAEAKSDADQALTFADFAAIMEDLRELPSYLGERAEENTYRLSPAVAELPATRAN